MPQNLFVHVYDCSCNVHLQMASMLTILAGYVCVGIAGYIGELLLFCPSYSFLLLGRQLCYVANDHVLIAILQRQSYSPSIRGEGFPSLQCSFQKHNLTGSYTKQRKLRVNGPKPFHSPIYLVCKYVSYPQQLIRRL